MKKILLIEDDFFIRDIYTKSFTNAGYSVDIAIDGHEALEKVKTSAYDIILLDIMLPKITGIDVLRSFRAPNSPVENIPIFLLTNLGQDDIIKEAFKIGADGYLLKAHLKPQEIVGEINSFFAEKDKSLGSATISKTTS